MIRRGRTVLLALSLLGAQAWADCRPPRLGAGLGTVQSRWQELDAGGAELVSETGTLASQALDLTLECKGMLWRAELQHQQGNRAYDGQTNNGSMASSSAGLDVYQWQLELLFPYLFWPSWQPGLRLRASDIRREIASTAQAQGYPERFRYWQLFVGNRIDMKLSGSNSLVLDAWLGLGPAGRMQLALPVADATELELGVSRTLALGAALKGELAPGWTWRAGLDWMRQDIAAGSASALLRNGVPFGAAHQPRIRMLDTALRAGLQYGF